MSNNDKSGKTFFWLTLAGIILLSVGLVLYVLNLEPNTVIQMSLVEKLSLGVINAN